jgi:cobalt/nickel transport protein
MPSRKASVQPGWFDSFTKTMLAIMLVLLLFIFAAAKYMDSHGMEAGGTDDAVNNMATQVSQDQHHPFIELPGDAQVGAFSVANLFVGLIIGHSWHKLFPARETETDEQEGGKVGNGNHHDR